MTVAAGVALAACSAEATERVVDSVVAARRGRAVGAAAMVAVSWAESAG